jgi:hypothetical protein
MAFHSLRVIWINTRVSLRCRQPGVVVTLIVLKQVCLDELGVMLENVVIEVSQKRKR